MKCYLSWNAGIPFSFAFLAFATFVLVLVLSVLLPFSTFLHAGYFVCECLDRCSVGMKCYANLEVLIVHDAVGFRERGDELTEFEWVFFQLLIL